MEMLSIKVSGLKPGRPHRARPLWRATSFLVSIKRTALGTLVERTTRYTLLVPLNAKDATSVRKAYVKALRSLPREITKTLTYDQGKEMSAAYTVHD